MRWAMKKNNQNYICIQVLLRFLSLISVKTRGETNIVHSHYSVYDNNNEFLTFNQEINIYK